MDRDRQYPWHKKGIATVATLATATLLATTACAGNAPSDSATYSLVVTMGLTETHTSSKDYLVPFLEELESRSDGRIKPEIHYGDALGNIDETYTMVRDGVADLGYIVPGYTPGRFDLAEISGLPFASPDNMVAVNVAINKLADDGYFDEEMNEVIPLHINVTAPYALIFRKGTKPPRSIEDFRGMKIRTPGGIHSLNVQSWGAEPVALSATEAYQAMQTGLVDAFANGPSTFIDFSFPEVADSALKVTFGYGTVIMGLNKGWFERLPADLQSLVMEVADENRLLSATTQSQVEAEAWSQLPGLGVDVYELEENEMDRMKAATLTVWEKWMEDREAENEPGRRIVADFVSYLKQEGVDPPYQS